MTLYPHQSSFVRGEVSPRIHSRADLTLYQAALSKCENFLTLPHGGLRKRGGTYFVSAVKDETVQPRLVGFKYSESLSYLLEVGDQYVRVFGSAGGEHLTEIVSPWASSVLRDLQYVQSAGVMWVVHPSYKPRKIEIDDNGDWSITTVEFTDGPFGPTNFDESVEVYASAATGTVTLTASSDVFTENHIGQLFRLEMESYRDIQPWIPQGVIDQSSMICRYDGNVYEIHAFGGGIGRFGSTPPTHLEGIEKDGPGANDTNLSSHVGVKLEYLHSGYGVARITEVTGGTTATALVLADFPDDLVGASGASYLYSFGAFGPFNWPRAVSLFEERLVFANKLSVYASKTGDFESFRVGEKGDDALEFLLAANEANDITWLADADGFLAIGTIGGVRALSGSGIDEALTPTSFKNRGSATHRCSSLRPMNTGQAFLYVTGGKRAVAEMILNQQQRFQSFEASQISEHLMKQGRGVVACAYQENPDPIAWFAMTSGDLVAFTYQRDQEVRGWHVHKFDGAVLDVAVTPGETSDVVWMLIRRVIDGTTRLFIERIQPAFEYDAVANAYLLDSGLTYSGDLVNAVEGLDHLEGATVSVLADAVKYDGLTVSAGRVELPNSARAAKWRIGIPYESTADTLELDVGGRDGSLIGRRKRVQKVIMNLLEADISGLQVSSLIRNRWEQAKLPTIKSETDEITLFTGNLEIPVDDSWAGQARVSIKHTGPGPCTIRSFTPVFDSEGTN